MLSRVLTVAVILSAGIVTVLNSAYSPSVLQLITCTQCNSCVLGECVGNTTNCAEYPNNTGKYCVDGCWNDNTGCSRACSQNCAGETCKNSSGNCYGCKEGLNLCKAACNPSVCNCSENCLNDTCEQYDGNACTYGCDPGWSGPICNVTCADSNCYECNRTDATICLQCNGTYWGENCDKNCPKNCYGECSQDSGDCVSGCKDGFWGVKCNQSCYEGCLDTCDRNNGSCTGGCDVGFWQSNCTAPCPVNCQASCRQTDGVCDGCMNELLTGPYCNESCSPNCANHTCQQNATCYSGCDSGFWRADCTQPCSRNCSRACDIDNAVCESCVPGLYGDWCNMTCPAGCNLTCTRDAGSCYSCQSGFYGEKCIITCSENCSTTYCDFKTGSCPAGCRSGSFGDNCTQSCPENCTETVCDQEAGNCTLGCVPGYYGQFCTFPCVDNCASVCDVGSGECDGCKDGYYGVMCEVDCPANCSDSGSGPVCGQQYGECLECKSEFWDTYCNKTCGDTCQLDCLFDSGECVGCDVGFFGAYCTELCPENCAGSCHQHTAQCVTCKQGTFGVNCTNTCPQNCEAYQCDQISGDCISGCVDGYWGMTCNTACPVNCSEVICDISDGGCDGCKDGQHGAQCTEPCNVNCQESRCQQDSGYCDCLPGYSGEKCAPTVNIGAIVGGVVAVIVVLVGVGVFLYFYLRRRRLQKSESERELHPRDFSSATGFHNQYEDTPILASTSPVDLPSGFSDLGIQVSKFQNYVKSRLAEETEPFLDEFKSVPGGLIHSWDRAINEPDKQKNRYKDIYPYDYNRVVLSLLPSDPQSDYINASHMMALDPNIKFIACMGPRSNTVNDFWRMLWEQEVHLVVMVTNCVELGKQKCEKYWPSENSQKYGEFRVVLESAQKWARFTLTHLNVSKGSEQRHMIHFQYLDWPDHGVPNDPTAILTFRRKLRPLLVPNKATVVHCSAGVGRTGTIIAIDALLEHAEKHGMIDVYGLVTRLRYQRRHMVQTVEQYAFIHAALAQYLKIGYTAVSVASFDSYYQKLFSDGNKLLLEHFNMLKELEVKLTPEEKDFPLDQENRVKNRDPNILPVMTRRHILMTHVREDNSYINAVNVDGHKVKNEYIVTEIPLQETVQVFWRMVCENKSKAIIYIINEDQKADLPMFLPTPDQPLHIHKHIAALTNIARNRSYTVSTVFIESLETVAPSDGDGDDDNIYMNVGTLKRPAEKSLLRIYEIITPRSQVLDLAVLLEVYQEVAAIRQKSSQPTIVACMNGALYSGQFVVCSNLFDMVTTEQEVDLFQTCKAARDSRPQFISTIKQYKSVFDKVKAFLGQFQTYANLPGGPVAPKVKVLIEL